MPSPMMKTNSMIDCSREKIGLHVCKKSSKISKNSFSHVKNSQQEAVCDPCTSNEQDDSFCDKVIVQEVRSGVANCCDQPAEESRSEKHLPASDHVATVCRMDQKQANSFPTVETIFSPILEMIDGDNEPNAYDDGGSEKGLDLPSLEDKEIDNRSRNSCEYRSCNLSDFFISDMIERNSANASCIPDYSCDESNRFFDDEYMLLPSLEDSIESSNGYDDNKFWLESVMISEESLDLAIHQLRSGKEEPDVNSYPDWDPSECLDPQTFIRNLPDLSESRTVTILPLESRQTKSITLVLDLDETLVHSSTELCEDADFTIKVFSNLQEQTMYVKKRPYLKEFLERVSKMFEIIVFTASQSIYANQLLDILDPDGTIINIRAFRESCIFEDGCYTKDLTVLGIDLAKVAIIDNCPEVFRLQINNGIPIKSWYDDPSDRSLISLLPFLETLVDAEDVRPIIARKFAAWWEMYGQHAPNLRNFAIRILGLNCSALGCERNWSIFEHLHSKKRNRLFQQRLNDLVFIKYNRALRRRYALRDVIDPISLMDIDESNKWLLGRLDGESDEELDYVFTEEDGLTWKDVSSASGAGEPHYKSRSQSSSKVTKKNKSKVGTSTMHLVDVDDDDADVEVLEEEEEECGGGDPEASNYEDDFNVQDDDIVDIDE